MTEKKGKHVEIKTKPTSSSVEGYINSISDDQKRKDCFVLMEMMKEETGEDPVLWGNGIIGFGNKTYKSPATGREVDWMLIGFAVRKANFSLHLTIDIKKYAATLERLGKHKTGVGCLYINKLGDIDLIVLKKIIETSLKNK